MSRIWAVARHTIAEGIRMKVALVFIGIILILLPVLPFAIAGDGLTLRSRVQSFLAYSLGSVGFLLSLLTVFLSCAALSNEIRSKQIFMIASKPIPRWQFFAGKWVGICAINVALLLLTWGSVYGFTAYLKTRPTTVPGDLDALNSEVLNARYGAKLDEPNWERSIEDRLRIMREQGKADGLSANESAALRQQIYTEEQTRWRTLRAGEFKEYAFSGLLVDREKPGYLHLHFKPTATSGVEDVELQLRWQSGDRNVVETLTPVGEASFIAGRFHTIPIPVQATDAQGVLHVQLMNMNEHDSFTFEGADSFELLYDIGTFHWNLFRALSIIWCRLAFIALVGLLASSFLSFPVACMACMLVLLVASASGFLTEAVDAATPRPSGEDPLWIVGPLLRPLAATFLWVVPDFSKFDPVGTVVAGRVVPLKWVLISVFMLVMIKGAIVGAVGAIIFTRRELAQVVV